MATSSVTRISHVFIHKSWQKKRQCKPFAIPQKDCTLYKEIKPKRNETKRREAKLKMKNKMSAKKIESSTFPKFECEERWLIFYPLLFSKLILFFRTHSAAKFNIRISHIKYRIEPKIENDLLRLCISFGVTLSVGYNAIMVDIAGCTNTWWKIF